MAEAIKLSDQLVAEENPDLPLRFVNDVLMGLEEAETGDLSEYRFE